MIRFVSISIRLSFRPKSLSIRPFFISALSTKKLKWILIWNLLPALLLAASFQKVLVPQETTPAKEYHFYVLVLSLPLWYLFILFCSATSSLFITAMVNSFKKISFLDFAVMLGCYTWTILSLICSIGALKELVR